MEAAMIQGISIDVKGAELAERIDARAAHHEERASACDAQLRELRTNAQGPARQQKKPAKQGGPVIRGAIEPFSEETLERKRRQHRERAQALMFLGQHIVRDEIYRVTEMDLRAADLLPDRSPLGDWLW
jgi:hypothetical protein